MKSGFLANFGYRCRILEVKKRKIIRILLGIHFWGLEKSKKSKRSKKSKNPKNPKNPKKSKNLKSKKSKGPKEAQRAKGGPWTSDIWHRHHCQCLVSKMWITVFWCENRKLSVFYVKKCGIGAFEKGASVNKITNIMYAFVLIWNIAIETTFHSFPHQEFRAK